MSPPTTDRALPVGTASTLPCIVIETGVLPINPKAAGEATVNTLSCPSVAKNFAPSAKRKMSAVLT
jgi:hypothetical protein